MKITPDTTIQELRSIKPMDYISDSMGRKGRVTNIVITKESYYVSYMFEIYAEFNGVYSKDFIFVKR